jgi:hypothetical protein
LNESDCKLITEKLLGECWEDYKVTEWPYYTLEYGREYSAFPIEGVESVVRFVPQKRRTFQSPQDFMDCFDRLVEKGELVRFIAFAGSKCDAVIFIKWLLSRTESGHYRLCVLCAEWLNENK